MRTVTYSAAYTLVPTYSCFNRCSYCNFRAEPGESPLVTLDAAREQLLPLQKQGIVEILILSGEVHPQSPDRPIWFQRIYDLCCLALEMGFLPHTNVGPLSYDELAQLKQVNVSMGLMVEQVTPTLLNSVHRHSPSKVPEVRLQQLDWAGQLHIPFTTGLLLGLGESETDWQDTLVAIATCHHRWHHIQEVILQPHSPGSSQTWHGEGFDLSRLPEVVAIARRLLPSDITIQIPPNLVHYPSILLECLDAGARDLGGLGPTDEVNPDYPHPTPTRLRTIIEPEGWVLQWRSPVYPHYYSWLPRQLQAKLEVHTDATSP
ncbi:MAG: 7,8-didemethyl-8-hydroxy-5-deazariboflavin synthase subunit CofG [Merismopedia sp. SIO2A8]|nr:7,8-didemethyl-8-hydroxy-5-deazariboflavin synthase subunit CofG [Merismopedia sp. SIO2A8]